MALDLPTVEGPTFALSNDEGAWAMLSLTIPTMSCGACEKRVRKALDTVGGIESVAIDLPTHKVDIAGAAEAAGVIEALRQAGYPPLGA